MINFMPSKSKTSTKNTISTRKSAIKPTPIPKTTATKTPTKPRTPKATAPKATAPKATTPKATAPKPTAPKTTTSKITTNSAATKITASKTTTSKATTSNSITPKPTAPKTTKATTNSATPNSTTPNSATPNSTKSKTKNPKTKNPKTTTSKATTTKTPNSARLKAPAPKIATSFASNDVAKSGNKQSTQQKQCTDKGGIYRYQNKNSRVCGYVGMTFNFEERNKQHIATGDVYATGSWSFITDPKPGFTEDQLRQAEKDAISKYKPKYNNTVGGNGRL